MYHSRPGLKELFRIRGVSLEQLAHEGVLLDQLGDEGGSFESILIV